MKTRTLTSNAVRIAAVATTALTLNTHAETPTMNRIWIGTYTTRGSEGVYSMTMNPQTGELSQPVLAAKLENPSFLALRPDKKSLYAVCEVGKFEGKPVGGVAALSVDAAAGKLTELNRESTGGASPCHVAVDPSGRAVVVANYMGGNAASFAIQADGKLSPMVTLVQHEGSGPNAGRQKAPHAHGATFDPSGKIVFIPDLGIDRVKAYAIDVESAKLAALPASDAKLTGGAGPRHFAFHPTLPVAYTINELTSDVAAFAWNADAKTFTPVASASTLPEGFKGNNSTAELAFHPNGKFLYGSNRGHNSIAVFGIEPKSGMPFLIEHASTGGKSPRSFSLDPSGLFLVAANQDSDNIVVLKVDAESGRLSETGISVKLPAPVCVLFQ